MLRHLCKRVSIRKYAIGVYFRLMEFIETSIFTCQINGLIPDDDYSQLQAELSELRALVKEL